MLGDQVSPHPRVAGEAPMKGKRKEGREVAFSINDEKGYFRGKKKRKNVPPLF